MLDQMPNLLNSFTGLVGAVAFERGGLQLGDEEVDGGRQRVFEARYRSGPGG